MKLTKEQAAIIGLYTGITAGPFSDVIKLAEDLLGRPIYTHEFANEALCNTLKGAVQPRFIEICAD